MREQEPELKYPWQQFVMDAFMELQPDSLPAKINAAERAISARLCEPNTPDIEESTALRDAPRSLRVLFPTAGETSGFEIGRADGHSGGKRKDVA
jgi:hypothetical protein